MFHRQMEAWMSCEPCVCSVGVNLLVGTENGLWLLDRSGQGKVYSLISRRRFQQMDVLEGLNVLITISGTCSVTSGTQNTDADACSSGRTLIWPHSQG